MPIPFLSSINLTKNEVENFKIYNLANDPGTLTSGGDFGYFWLNTSSQKTLKWWDGANVRSIVDSTNIGSYTSGLATDLAGGAGGYLPYQAGTNDTTFLPLGTAAQILAVNSGLTAPEWINQSAITAGSVANALTAGTYLTSGGTYNGSAARTFAVDATSANTASKVVARDASGNFSAGTITASLSGNATSADSVNNALTAGTYLTSGGTFNGSVARTFAVDATSSNTASKVVARDASGNFSAGTITATTVTGLSAPSAGSDAANRDYVDSVAQGLDVKASCLVATTADITLSSPGAISIDNIPSTSFTSGTTRILVRAQNTASQNGIYIWNGSGSAMTRSADANTWDELVSAFTFIEQGDTLKDTGWVCTIDAGTLGTTAVTWSQFSGAGSYTANRGLVLSGTAFNFAQNSDYAVGDLPYATGQTTIGLLPAVATGNALISGGVATAPSWGKIGLTTHVSGTLPIANGGTGATSFTQGQVLFAGASAISSSANLFWDNSNNRLGIGTATPGVPLSVFSSDSTLCSFVRDLTTDAGVLIQADNGGAIFDTVGIHALRFFTNATERLKIASDGVCTWSNVGGVAGTAMTLNGTGLGVGTATINQKLTVGGNISMTGVPAGNRYIILGDSTDTYTGTLILQSGAGSGSYGGNIVLYGHSHATYPGGVYIGRSSGSTGPIIFGTGGLSPTTPQMVIDSSGNVGIGTTTPGKRLTVADASPTIRLNDTNTSVAGGVFGTIDWLSQDSSMPGGLAAKIDVYDDLGGYGDRGAIRFFTNNGTSLGERMVLTSSGNLGLGVTPSAWGTGYWAVQAPYASGLFGNKNAPNIVVGTNVYLNNSGQPIYHSNNQPGASYELYNGAHIWYNAPNSGASGAGTVATFTPRMTLDASGRLMVNTVTPYAFVTAKQSASYDALTLDSDSATTYTIQNFRINGVQKAQIFCDYADGSMVYRTNTSGSSLSFGTNNAERLRIKSTGQLNFNGLASDPAGAAGDVYYNSGSNVFKVYDTGWKTLPRKYSTALAGTSTTFDVTHNLGTQDVTVMVRKSASTFDVVYTDIQVATTNKVTIVFASSVTGSDYTVTVIG